MESGGSMTDLLTLAERCEQATGPDRELDVAIAVAAGVIRERDGNLCYATGNDSDYVLERGYYDLEGGPQELPYFTASLDAAMTLVPERCPWTLEPGSAWLRRLDDSDPSGVATIQGHNRNGTALALCAAALRARVADQSSGMPKGGEL
jgi:hypothetical protein